MLNIAQSRQLHMKDVLSHPLGPLLWALANGDGSLWKTNKAVLASEERERQNVFRAILSLVLHEGAQSQLIDVNFDVYLEQSIKNA